MEGKGSRAPPHLFLWCLTSPPHPPSHTHCHSSADAALKARQAEARAWITPWLAARQNGGSAASATREPVKPKKPKAPAAAVAASAATADGGKGEMLADGSIMFRF